jgi:hypothetical protein
MPGELVTVSAFSVTLEKPWIFRNAPVGFTFTAPPGQPWADWVGLYNVGAPNYPPLAVHRTKGLSTGTIRYLFTLPKGRYEYRYFIDDGYICAAVSNPFWVFEPKGFTVTTTKTAAMPGELVTVQWTAAQDTSPKDWIGLFAVGAGNRQIIQWVFTGGLTSGSTAFRMPMVAGDFEFRYLLDNGYGDVARSATIRVGNGF